MEIKLSGELAAFVKGRVAAGKNPSEEDVVEEALRALGEDELFDGIVNDIGIEALRAGVQESLDQLDRGEGIVIQNEEGVRAFAADIKARGRKRLAERHAAQTS
ncbi:hypothetical protein HN371_24570 [Candidatus Poribacteria bacterium]|nr:hypothetical protein [Candidatus Poribacteria bacterium]MBT5535365.1 hypothetical protein [Candidatus Poribacteria bacterium]MBT5714355.1 hypothetical protein [Candidatus Poribacteria bacterium]MBT7097536.1 hypothetical protein [Candidatus Poribacteria bacterium]MBT7804901.1 hypothetical protein [Candidatus Poribacteria bacterium]